MAPPAALGGVGLQVLGLQRLHVILVDFKCGAELYGQSSEDVVPGHQEKRLAIDFLSDWEMGTHRLAGRRRRTAVFLAKFMHAKRGN